MWQQQDPRRRFPDNRGPQESGSEQNRPSEVLAMVGLASPVVVLDVLSTQADLLCYQYYWHDTLVRIS